AGRGCDQLCSVATRDDARMKEKGVEQKRHAEASRNTVELKRRALAMGFTAVGVASLEPNAHAAELDRWLAAGYAGTMTYLHRQAAKRKEPARIMPEATAAVVTLTNYFHDPGPPARGQPRVAQYAQSADYHRVLGHPVGRAPLHRLSHGRAPRGLHGGRAGARRGLAVRLRHMPGCVPVERAVPPGPRRSGPRSSLGPRGRRPSRIPRAR